LLLRIHHGLASIQVSRGRLEGTPSTASAEVGLVDPYPFTGRIDLQRADLATIQRLSPEVKPLVSISGQLDVAADIRGTLNPFQLELRASQLRVQGIPIEHAHGSLDYRNQALMYQFEGETLGGRFHLNGEIPAAKPGPAGSEPPEGHLQVEGVHLGR